MPAKSKRLQVIDRIVTVLRGIQEGDSYWKSPREVGKGSSRAVSGYPSYRVYAVGGPITRHLDQQNDGMFHVIVEAQVQEEENIVDPVEHAIQDIQEAVNNDFRSGSATDSLISLAVDVFFDEFPTPEIGFGDNGLIARFEQRIQVQIYGEFGEL